jgi:hypothetical protein
MYLIYMQPLTKVYYLSRRVYTIIDPRWTLAVT